MDYAILFKMSMMMGFLLAGFIALLIGGLIAGLVVFYRSAMKKFEGMVKDMEKWGGGSAE